MAKSEIQIRLDFEHAIRQANKLDEIAGKIQKIASNNLDECNKRIAGAWKGDSAVVFQKKGQQVANNLEKLAKEYKNTANAIRKIATNTYQAEQAALELAKKRTYS